MKCSDWSINHGDLYHGDYPLTSIRLQTKLKEYLVYFCPNCLDSLPEQIHDVGLLAGVKDWPAYLEIVMTPNNTVTHSLRVLNLHLTISAFGYGYEKLHLTITNDKLSKTFTL